MNVRIRSPRDFFAGAIFMLFGLCAVLVGRDYPMGTALHMGSGYFPFVLGALLLVLGAVICIKGLVITGDRIESIGLRPLVLVLLAIGAFAAAVDTIGLVAATVMMTIIGAAASSGLPSVCHNSPMASDSWSWPWACSVSRRSSTIWSSAQNAKS